MEKLSLYFAWYISERPRRGLILLNRCVPRSGTCGNAIISPSLTLQKGATLASVRPLFEVESILYSTFTEGTAPQHTTVKQGWTVPPSCSEGEIKQLIPRTNLPISPMKKIV